MKKALSLILSLACVLGTMTFTTLSASAEESYKVSVDQTYEDGCRSLELLKASSGVGEIIAEDGNKVFALKAGAQTTAAVSTNIIEIPSNRYIISFDLRAVSPNAPLAVVINNPCHEIDPGFNNGFTVALCPGTFVSENENGAYGKVDDTWYTYTFEVDVTAAKKELIGKLGVEDTKSLGESFVKVSRKNRDTGAIDGDFGFTTDLVGDGVRFYGYSLTAAPDGITFAAAKNFVCWDPDAKQLSSLANKGAFGLLDYRIDNIRIIYDPAASTVDPNDKRPDFTNVFMQLGSDITERNFTWFSRNTAAGILTYAKASEMVNGEFPEDAKTVVATRDVNTVRFKSGYINNKATVKDLEPGESYFYQLSNGESKSDIYTLNIGEKTYTFSFIFTSDIQIGTSNEVGLTDKDKALFVEQAKTWGMALRQFASDPVFADAAFVLNAGDQINTDASTHNYIENELQYDAYFNHDDLPSLAMTSLLGNHDSYARGGHYQHFNEPNYVINPRTGKYYGASYYNSSTIEGADYWFTYNSMLFVCLNTNNMSNPSGSISRETAKAAAEEHIDFISYVLNVNKYNEDIKWKVVMYHQSPYGASYHNNYTRDKNGNYSARPEQKTYIYMREYLLPAIYEKDFDVVFSGHDHVYTRSHILKHEAVSTDGMYYGNETITPYANTSGENYYTYADGTTTPSFVDWTDINGVVHTDKKVSSVPVKVTDPDGVLHISGSSARSGGTGTYPNVNAAFTVMNSKATRYATLVEVTANTLTFTTYGLGTDTKNFVVEDNVIDTFTIEKTHFDPIPERGPVDSFTDVHPAADYYGAVDYVTRKGLFNGTSETTFSPDDAMNRAMFVTVLGRLEGADTSKYSTPTFGDVKADQWYTAYVGWASENGIVNGIGGGNFGIDAEITVEQACTILYRYSNGKTVTLEGDIPSMADFTDASDVSPWASDGVKWAVENGIYNGTSGKLEPTMAASRAVVATMFANYVSVFG